MKVLFQAFVEGDSLPAVHPSTWDLYRAFYEQNKFEIQSVIGKECDINVHTWEGGIDGWFGYGSAFSSELGLRLQIITDVDSFGYMVAILK